MNIQIDIPSKITILDDNEDNLSLLKLLISEKGFTNIVTFSDIKKLLESIDNSSQIFIIDYHLSTTINGADVANMIKEKNQYAEFIFISSLLSSEEYECLINTCGCNAISRKHDLDKICFLLKRAINCINKEIIRTMEIVLQGKAILEKIENY